MKSFLVIIAALLHTFSGFGQDGVEARFSRLPILVAPADSATSVPVRPLFVWSRAGADSLYFLQIGPDTSFSAPIIVDTVAFDTMRACPIVLANDSTFFWRVGILGMGPDSLFSVVRTFRTTRLPVLSTRLLDFPDTRKGRDTTREVVLYNTLSETLVVDSAGIRTAAWRVSPGLRKPRSDTVTVDSAGSPVTAAWRVAPALPEPMSDTLVMDSADSSTAALSLTPGLRKPRSDTLVVDTAGFRAIAPRFTRALPEPMSDTLVVDSAWSRTAARDIMPAFPCRIMAGDSLVLRVTYRPEWFGVFKDTLHVATDAGICTLPLAGLCSPPALFVSPSFVALGPIAFTDTGQVSVVIRNTGRTNDLSLHNLTTRTPLFSFFPAVFPPISPGDSQRVRVKFHMRALRRELFGIFFDTLLVDSDGGRERVVMRGESPPPRIGVEPVSLSLGDVAARDTLRYDLRIVNGSINPLRLDSIRTRGRSFNPGLSRGQVRQTDTLIVPVRFTSTRHGQHADTLTLFNNSWRGPVRIPLLSFVPFPEVLPESQHGDFGSVVKKDTARLVFRFSNPSISLLRVDSVSTRTRFFRLYRPKMPFYVPTGDSLVVSVEFIPDSARHFSDTLTIVSNAASSPDRIPLWGDAVFAGAAGGGSGLPGTFELFPNYPNPFNASTTFRYAVPEPSHVRLELFTTLGQMVAVLEDADRVAGFYDVRWSTDVTSGTYYYRMSATPHNDPGRTFVGTKRLVILR